MEDRVDYIFNLLYAFDRQKERLTFRSNDVRRDFFEMTHKVINQYYIGYLSILSMALLDEDNPPNFDIISKKHFENIKHVNVHKVWMRNYFNSLNRNLLIDAWSMFETCLTAISISVFDDNTKLDLGSEKYKSTIEILKKIELGDDILNKLKKLHIQTNFSLVDSSKKNTAILKLMKKSIKYSRDINLDRDFLQFVGKYRNCLHSNFIYFGSDYSYTFKEKFKFNFQNGKQLQDGNEHPALMLDIIIELSEVFKEIALSLDIDYIPYLDEKAR